MGGRSDSESAAEEAFEEAGVRGFILAQALGYYDYDKRLGVRGKSRCRVTVFPLEVKEYFDLWPEAHQRQRRWLSWKEAARQVQEPELAAIIARFGAAQSGPALKAPTYLQAIWQLARAVLRRAGLL